MLKESQSYKEFFFRYWVFRAWGRIGTTIGKNALVSCDTANSAKELFKEQYLDKTGNSFEDRDNFVKVSF